MTEKLAQSTDIRTALVVGGLSMQVQASTLKTSPEIVVATPVSHICHFGFRLWSWTLLPDISPNNCVCNSFSPPCVHPGDIGVMSPYWSFVTVLPREYKLQMT